MLVQRVKNKSFYCSKNLSFLHIWTAIIYNRDYKQWMQHVIVRLQRDKHLCERHTNTEKRTEATLSLNSCTLKRKKKKTTLIETEMSDYSKIVNNKLGDNCNCVLILLPSYKNNKLTLQKCSQICEKCSYKIFIQTPRYKDAPVPTHSLLPDMLPQTAT